MRMSKRVGLNCQQLYISKMPVIMNLLLRFEVSKCFLLNSYLIVLQMLQKTENDQN